jgi:hypothetical protein
MARMILNIHIEHNALKDAASSQVGYILSCWGENISPYEL